MLHKQSVLHDAPVSLLEKRPNHAEIERRIASALAEADDLDDTDVRVFVVGHEASLMGKVASNRQAHRAERIALSANGIRRVRNMIEVKERSRDARAQSRTL